MPATRVLFGFAVVIGLVVFAAAQRPDVPQDASITLQRTSCFGPCPVYTVTIDARGAVTYEGERFVRVVGRRTAQIDPSIVTKLLAMADRIGFFELRDSYRVIRNPDGTETIVTDLPTTFVTVTANGRSKKVEDYIAAPESLSEFEREIDAAAGTERWVFVNEHELDALTRSGWRASSEEGAELLKQAIERDAVPIARRLIDLGAALNGPPNYRMPSLFHARSRAMVELLVKAGADPNERRGEFTPLMSASYKDAGIAEALLKAGARLEDMEEGRTALWYAACGGNWRVVTTLLAAGANPRGSMEPEVSAAECARRRRQGEAGRERTLFDRGQPTVEDFDRVIALLARAETRKQ